MKRLLLVLAILAFLVAPVAAEPPIYSDSAEGLSLACVHTFRVVAEDYGDAVIEFASGNVAILARWPGFDPATGVLTVQGETGFRVWSMFPIQLEFQRRNCLTFAPMGGVK